MDDDLGPKQDRPVVPATRPDAVPPGSGTRPRQDGDAGFRSIVEASPMGIHLYSLEPDGRLVLRGANAAADRILGVDHRPLEGLTIEQAFPQLAATEVPARYREIAARGTAWTVPQIDYHDGRIRGAYEVYAFQTTPGFMAAMFLDITARLQSEAALREKTEELDTFFSSALDLLCIADTSGRFRRLNAEWERTLGYRLEDLLGRRFTDFVHPDDLDATLEATRRLAAQQSVINFTNRYRHQDGSWRWIEWRSYSKGNIIHAAARDVTSHRETEEALRASERLSRMVAELTSDYLFHLAVTPEGEVTLDFLTGNIEAIGGGNAPAGRAITSWQELFAPAEHAVLESQLRRLVDERTPVELVLPAVSGERHLWLRLNARPEVDAASGRVVGVIGGVKDVTAQKALEQEQARLEEQLRQAMKMEAIGRLAGGVAHDFNNLLTAILGNLELAMSDLGADERVAEPLREAVQAATSAAALTRQLLAFSRKQIVEPRVLDLGREIARLHQMLVRLLGEDIRLDTIAQPGLGAVRVDPGQFEQVVVNLAVNARDAMPRGGRLVIETANVELDEEYCSRHPQAPLGPCVRLAVTDTGDGMPPEVISRLFEPFFTTKSKEHGTGLGLATTYGIVKQAGGAIEVYSEVGHGTTFKVYLPRVDEQAEAWQPGDRQAVQRGGGETILLVEDEAQVRQLALRVLRRLGYDVLEAASGPEALALAEERTAPIHLLLTDVVMPGMSGRELASRLSLLFPSAKVLYTSGYTENVVVHHGVLDAGLRFLSKPYTPQTLADAVRRALDE